MFENVIEMSIVNCRFVDVYAMYFGLMFYVCIRCRSCPYYWHYHEIKVLSNSSQWLYLLASIIGEIGRKGKVCEMEVFARRQT
jgi:hypothetical protein